MKKAVIFPLLLAVLFITSCDMFQVDVIEYLDYYTNTAGIEELTYDGNYPVDSSGIINIPSGADRVLTFTLRNPQNYTLTPTVAFDDSSISSGYTIAQSPTDKSLITLTFDNLLSLQSWDETGGKNISGTISLLEPDSGRFFDEYSFEAFVNSKPIAPSRVSLVKNDDVENKWFLAFDVGTLDDRQGIHSDIKEIIIDNISYGVSISNGGMSFDDDVLKTEYPTSNLLVGNDGYAFTESSGNNIFFNTNTDGRLNETCTVSFKDSNGLQSESITVTTVGKKVTHYYVESGADSANTGTANSPFPTVQQAITEIQSYNDENSMYTIHIKGEVSGGSSGTNGSAIIDSNVPLNITIKSWDDSGGTIKAGSGKRVLYVHGANVTLGENLTLTGGNVVDGGGVYVDSGALTLDGATISGNTATQNGGGVFINSGTFTMNGISTVSGNKATNNNGGGVYVNNGTFTMNGGTIGGATDAAANTANIDGGGIFINYGSSVIIDGGTIRGNKASLTPDGGCSGGAIFVEDGATLTMNSGIITENEADNGGAIAINGDGIYNVNVPTSNRATFTMFGGNISGNTVHHEAGGESKGGAVYVVGSLASFTMIGGTIGGENQADGNKAINGSGAYGGGVYVGDGASFTLNKGEISGNTTTDNGGGVYIADGTFTMNNSAASIKGNSADSGGGVYLHSGTFNFSAGTITGNERANADDVGGGGVYIDHIVSNNKTLNLSGSPFITGNGVKGMPDEVDNVRFNNEAAPSPVKITSTLTGGNIGLYPYKHNGGEIVVQSGVNDANKGVFTSDIAGVKFYRDGSDLKVQTPLSEVFLDGTKSSSGDGTTPDKAVTSFQEAYDIIESNTATIWLTGTVDINSDETWNGNGKTITVKRYSTHEGALASLVGGTLTLENITVDGGATKSGEAFSGDTANNALVTVSGGKLILNSGATLQNNNRTSGNGGAINATGGTIEMKVGSEVKNNKADGDGGGVYTSGTATFKMDGGTVLGNISYHGGGVYIAAVDDADADGDGSADEMFTFSGGIIGGTTADAANVATKGDGGGLYLNSSKAKISSTAKVIGNEAEYGGGVYLYNTGAKLTMNGGSIGDITAGSANTANMEGGGIFLRNDTELSMTAGTIVGNTADANGGGIYSQGNIEITGDSARIEQNTGNSGGGVYVYSGTFTMSNGTITQNNRRDEPTYAGGGVYLDHGNRGSFKLSGNPQITGNGIKDDTSGIKDNVSFDNKDGNTTPLSLAAGLDNTALIGLNPVVKDPDDLLVTGGGYDFTTANFPMDNTAIIAKKDSNDLRVNYTKLNAVFLDGDEGVDTRSGADSASAVKTFAKALELLQDTDTAAIWITKTVQVTTSETWNGQANSRTHKAVVKRNDASISASGTDFDGNLIEVTGSSTTLILQNITIDGQGGITADFDIDSDTAKTKGEGGITAAASLIHVNGGNLILNSNATLQNNKNTSNGGGIYITSGNVTMDGGKIIGNESLAEDDTTNGGGGIFVNGGSFTLNSGYIHENSAVGNGGGVAFNQTSAIFSSGGFITGNSARVGGGISTKGLASLTIGGSVEISANEATYGAGINFDGGNTSTLTIEGGKIHSNISDAYGGGVRFDSGKDFTMSNGSIYENQADLGGGIFVFEGTFKMTGGSITKNDVTGMSDEHGGGVFLRVGGGATLELSGNPIIDNNTLNENNNSNVYFTNEADSSPISVVGALNEDSSGVAPSIGLSPSNAIEGYMVVLGLTSDTDAEKFFHDERTVSFVKIENNLKIKATFSIGDTGPSGGVVFDTTVDAHKEAIYVGGSVNWYKAQEIVGEYAGGGCTDWYLPTIDMLKVMWDGLHEGHPVFGSALHIWSSTDSSNIYSAYVLTCKGDDAGSISNGHDKDTGLSRVIAVRSFDPQP